MIDTVELTNQIQEARELNNVRIKYINKDDPTSFIVSLKVYEGLYRGPWYHFKFIIPDDWPNNVPTVRLLDTIWHPCFEYVRGTGKDEGRFSIPALCSHSKNIKISLIVESLKYLIANPDPYSTMNVDASNEYTRDYDTFKLRASDLISDMIFKQEEEEEEEEET